MEGGLKSQQLAASNDIAFQRPVSPDSSHIKHQGLASRLRRIMLLAYAALLALIHLGVSEELSLGSFMPESDAERRWTHLDDGFAARQEAVSPLVNFQVSQPLTLPRNAKQCVVPLLRRNFANSYYKPEIIEYTPPTQCGEIGSWAGISLNWTATSNGTQYDRLSAVTFQNVEIWRTSTAEPTKNGIIWTVLKDVTKYIPLFAKPGRLILDLNNVVDPSLNLTGEYDVRLSATFYASSPLHPPAKKADLIIPLSNLRSDDGNYVAVPPRHNNTVKLPRNAVAAFAEIQASGNWQEEFWYFNVPDQHLPSLPPDTTYGKGPFREVRLLVDGQLAGVVFPFAVWFTGAWVPTVWRPFPAYGAFDLPTYSIDLTPFVPILADGNEHTVSLEVASAEPDHSINLQWYVSGNIQVLVDSSTKPTVGRITSYNVPVYPETSHSFTPGPQTGDLKFTVRAQRQLEIKAEVISGSGKINNVVWRQNLEFSNTQTYLDNANYQQVKQSSTGHSLSTHNGIPVLSDALAFPMAIEFFWVENSTGYTTNFDHAYNRAYLPSPLLFTTDIKTHQVANGTYIIRPPTGPRYANGTNTQEFAYFDLKGNTYTRKISATNANITHDNEGGSLAHPRSAWPWRVPVGSTDSLQPQRLPGGRRIS